VIPPRSWWAWLLVAALAVGACGTEGDDTGSSATGTGPATTLPATTAPVATTDLPTTTAPLTTATTTPTGACTPSTAATGSTTTSSPETTTTISPPSSSSLPSSSATTAAPTTTPPDQELAAHQRRLTDLGYWLGPVDGRAGPLTAHAVTAFQKAEGLPRTGRLDGPTTERLAAAVTPSPRSTDGTVLEIDRDRQILLIASDGAVTRIYDIATGAAATPTPVGRYQVYTEIDGYRYAPLGTLYRPKYFNGGIALHGYTSVPPEPASHGCVRLTYAAMDDLWATGVAPIGTPVWVY
jgi:peptidoglycan hydrolase-like protein with peptidoglycan-binding domain